MTLTEIDRALEDWHAKIAAATDNLLTLEDLPVVRRLRPEKGPKPALTGQTAVKVQPALALLPQLFQDISLLTDVITRAEELRRPLTAFWRPERAISQIEHLLAGPSVALPAIQTPFAQRGLLSASEQARAISLSALLALMSHAFDEVKVTLLEAESAWTRAESALGAARDKIAILERMAGSLGEADAADLIEIRKSLERWAGQVATDPLGRLADSEDGAEMFRRTRERLEDAAALRDKADARRDEARSILAQWEEIRRANDGLRAECAAWIILPPRDADRLPEMRQWLATLESAYARRNWLAAGVGLDHWLEAARGGLLEERDAANVSEAWRESLEDLPGRFAALRAKAAARGLGTHFSLVPAGRNAETILKQKPFPLARAEAAVAAYADMLNALLKERR